MKKNIKTTACVAAMSVICAGVAFPAAGRDLPEAVATAHSGSPAPVGYIERGVMMLNDANPRGTLDQIGEALRGDLTLDEAERAEIAAALAAVSVPGMDADALLQAFLKKYPASQWRMRALLAIADILYDRHEYAVALKAYNDVAPQALDPSLANSARYRKAYCLLKMAEYDRASAIYESLRNDGEFANDARFYLGYIAYIKGDYRRAADLLRGVRRNGMPSEMADYYLAQISFVGGGYADAARDALALLARSGVDAEFVAEANRIAGESLCRMGDYTQGLPYLRRYVASTGSPQPSALYILGVDAYEHGDWRGAVELLTPVSGQDSAIGQSAYLYIGQCYQKLDNYNAATLAFDKASAMTHDSHVQELAFYNLAVARMQGGKVPFGSSVGLFEEFLRRYPDSDLAPEVAGYVVQGYMTDNNYAAALAAIEGIANPSEEVLGAKQKVLYTLGTRELQGGDTRSALAHLTEAASMQRHDASIAAEATLWAGECRYKLGDYAGAVKEYNSYLRNPNADKRNKALAWYDLGYAQFALKKFSEAGSDFRKFIAASGQGTDRRLLADAYNRLADSQYYTSDFAGAAENYGAALEADPASGDYPMYQQGLMKGLRRDYAGKIETLSAMTSRFPASALVPSALLEMAESYGELGSADRAIETYTALVGRYPSTSQGRQGQLLLAITYLNEGNRSRAMEHYKRVITSYPSSEEARVAADDLKQLYADDGKVGEYVAFINNVPDAPRPETAELARLTLLSAEKAMEQGREADALASAAEVVEKYPDSPQAVDALAIKAEVEFRQGKGGDALKSYMALEQRASEAADVNAARMGIMRVSRDLGDNDRVIETADRLLASSALGASGKREVAFTKALALADTERGAEAVEIWESLSSDIDDLYGTKSAFNLAMHYADNKEDAKALEAVNRLIEANPPHDYWLARGFILLSDLLRRKGDTFEADEYLRSLKQNYPGNEADIFRMIDERLY
ncbi:MAG: tetratricopeptide repeat protein [Muribaculaceae bacterium]|nr:tetratricopeptide repeat protein [Muribaculaceae bacterium]